MTRDLTTGFELDPAVLRAVAGLATVDRLTAEGCLRVPAAPASLVVGFAREHQAQLLHAVDCVAPAHRERVARWLSADGIHDVGYKLGGGDLQIYVRGDFEPTAIATGFEAAGVACQPVLIRRALMMFDQVFAVMQGLELAGDRAAGAVYGGVRRGRAVARAIEDAFRFLVSAFTGSDGLWPAVAPILIDAPGEELLYFSFSPTVEDGWVKLDVGERPLGVARRLLEATGRAEAWPGVLAEIERRGIARWSHVGVRFDARGVAVVLYWSIVDELT